MATSTDEDSLRSMLDRCILEEDSRTLSDLLAEFPHTFQMQIQGKLNPAVVKGLKSGLESALAVGYKTNLETARARNLLAYTWYQQRKPEDALHQLDKVLVMEDQAHNLVTLANKAVILRHQCEFSSAKNHIRRLHQIQREDADFQYLVVKANAELAFSYTRLGPSFSSCAVELFQEVIPKAREPEVWLWKFGLGLTRRRALRTDPHSASSTPSADYVAKNEDLLNQFVEIKNKCSCRNLKAKAYSEIANVLFNIYKTNLHEEQKNNFFKMVGVSTVKEACDEAYKLDSKDRSILCKCGLVLRRLGKAEEARERLEESLFRPSSRVHHHLGNIYIFLASPKNCSIDNTKQRSEEGSEVNITEGARFRSSDTTGAPGATEGLLVDQSKESRCMQRTIKSPATVKPLTRDDANVQKALEHYEKAIEISEGENIQARYDLALAYRGLREHEKAKRTLQKILCYPQKLSSFDQVKTYEQLGQIQLQLAETERDQVKQKDLHEDGKSLLLIALQRASQIFSKSAKVRERVQDVLVSFPVLMKMATESQDSEAKKLAEQSRLLYIIRKNRASLDLLEEIEQLDPELANEPENLKLKIENYAELEQYEKAVTFIRILRCTHQYTDTMKLLKDKQYVLKITLKAARQVLLKGAVDAASAYFCSAFEEFVSANPKQQSTSEREHSPAAQDAKHMWDIVIGHEDSAQEEAMALIHVLQNICGLRVPIMDRDVLPNQLELDGELNIVINSSLVVVMAGGETSPKMRFFMENTATRPTTVTLLMEGSHKPPLLTARRSLDCYSSPSLFKDLKSAQRKQRDNLTESEVDTIYSMLCFFFNISTD